MRRRDLPLLTPDDVVARTELPSRLTTDVPLGRQFTLALGPVE